MANRPTREPRESKPSRGGRAAAGDEDVFFPYSERAKYKAPSAEAKAARYEKFAAAGRKPGFFQYLAAIAREHKDIPRTTLAQDYADAYHLWQAFADSKARAPAARQSVLECGAGKRGACNADVKRIIARIDANLANLKIPANTTRGRQILNQRARREARPSWRRTDCPEVGDDQGACGAKRYCNYSAYRGSDDVGGAFCAGNPGASRDTTNPRHGVRASRSASQRDLCLLGPDDCKRNKACTLTRNAGCRRINPRSLSGNAFARAYSGQ